MSLIKEEIQLNPCFYINVFITTKYKSFNESIKYTHAFQTDLLCQSLPRLRGSSRLTQLAQQRIYSNAFNLGIFLLVVKKGDYLYFLTWRHFLVWFKVY